jgi:hypothetical protein
MIEALRAIQHPSRSILLSHFPEDGLLLNPETIKLAIEAQLDARNALKYLTSRPSREGKEPIRGMSRIFRAKTYPYILLTSYYPDGQSPIPDKEVYRAMSFPREFAHANMDFAEGLWVVGERGKYRALVQALDPSRPKSTRSFSYEHNQEIMPPNAPDNHRAAAMRTMSRLGLI